MIDTDGFVSNKQTNFTIFFDCVVIDLRPAVFYNNYTAFLVLGYVVSFDQRHTSTTNNPIMIFDDIVTMDYPESAFYAKDPLTSSLENLIVGYNSITRPGFLSTKKLTNPHRKLYWL